MVGSLRVRGQPLQTRKSSKSTTNVALQSVSAITKGMSPTCITHTYTYTCTTCFHA